MLEVRTLTFTVMGRRCPRDVQALIGLVNALPSPTLALKSPGELLPNPDAVDVAGEMRAIWQREIASLPVKIRRFIGPITVTTHTEAMERYAFLRDAQGALTALAERDIDAVARVTSVVAAVVANHLEFDFDPIVKILTGVDVRRIARCVECGRFLWLRRLRPDPVCSNRCRQTRWRERNPERWALIQNEHDARRAKKKSRSRRVLHVSQRRA